MSRARRRGLIRLAALLGAVGALLVWFFATGGSGGGDGGTNRNGSVTRAALKPSSIPPPLDPHDVYAADRPGRLSPVVRHFPSRVYVPNSESNSVSVIDPQTYKVIDTFPAGTLPQHVVPSYDLKTLWVNNDEGNTLTPINPATASREGRSR